MNELNKLRDQAYENSLIYKEKTKKIHDSKIKNRVFNVGDWVLLLNSRLKIFSGKLKTCWTGPFIVAQVFPYGTVELSQTDGPNFKVNGGHTTDVYPGSPNFPHEPLNSGSSQARDSVNKNKRFDCLDFEDTCNGYSLKDKNKAKTDKTKHGIGKSVKSQSRRRVHLKWANPHPFNGLIGQDEIKGYDEAQRSTHGKSRAEIDLLGEHSHSSHKRNTRPQPRCFSSRL
ncbi:hypothetical protein Tco_0170134 [Tanacetum coccineum]